jgi:hypothetical protein
MQTAERLNPDQIFQFLKLGDTIEFAGPSRAERYAFAQQLRNYWSRKSMLDKARSSVAPSAPTSIGVIVE